MLHIALKEWSIVCDLLLEGSLALLLRKGGIHERKGPGVFELEHPRFALWPSWAHQKPDMIKERFRARVQVIPEPAQIPIPGVAQVDKIWHIESREKFDLLDDLHCWSRAQIDMRFNYKPDHPLYLMAVRAWRLPEPRCVPNDWTYGGCKSWVPLQPAHGVDDSRVKAAMSDGAFDELVRRVDAVLPITSRSSGS
jgi:hypothetical protein